MDRTYAYFKGSGETGKGMLTIRSRAELRRRQIPPEGYEGFLAAMREARDWSEALFRWLTNSINEGYAGKYQTIAVRFGLQKKQFEQYTASILQLETVRVLDPNVPDDAKRLQRLGKLFAEVQKYYRKRGAQDVAATDRYAGETPDDGIPI